MTEQMNKQVDGMNMETVEIYAAMPCPMKVPFRRVMAEFMEEYNSAHAVPVTCPDVSDCASEELGTLVGSGVDVDRLPDVIITNSYEFFFEYPFAEKFLRTGIYLGVTHDEDLKILPANIRRNLVENNFGALCFGSQSVVLDMTVGSVENKIGSWEELLSPALYDAITVHGHIDRATFGLMCFLDRNFGMEGIVRYAGNIADIKHFSQVIKRMCSVNEYRTAVNILPDVAAAKIPSSKKIRIADMKEGKTLSPIILVVKAGKMAQCGDLLAFFHGKKFRTMLGAGCLLPEELDGGRTWFMPALSLMEKHYRTMADAFDRLYLSGLDMERIGSRATEGGLCKG